MENKLKKAFEPVNADETMKSDVKQFLRHAESEAMPKRNHFQFKRPLSIAVAACLIVILAGVFQMQTLYAQAAYVELTGPTQLGISLNRKNEVLEVIGLNESGQIIAESVDVEHMPYEEALDTIVNCNAYQENSDSNVQIDVSVDCENEDSAATLKQETEKVCLRQQKRQGQTPSSDSIETETSETEDAPCSDAQNENSGNGQKNRKGHSK